MRRLGHVFTPGDRDEWYDRMAEDVCALGPELVGRLQLPETARRELAAAAVLASVFVDDRWAVPSYRSAWRLQAAGVVGGDEWEVAESLVQPARRRWRENGVPIANWWAPGELLTGLLERLTPEVTDGFLTAVFEISRPTVDLYRAMPTALPKPPSLPIDLLATVGDDPAIRLLAGLATRPIVEKVLKKERAATVLWAGPIRPPHWDREERAADEDWLRSAWTTDQVWSLLAVQLGRLDTGSDPGFDQVVARAVALCNSSIEASQQWFEGLGHPELALLMRRDEVDLRRRRFLHARLQVYEAWLQMPDSVPDQVTETEPAPVPAWVANEIFDRGTRLWHSPAGPHVLWWAAAETSTEAALLRPVPLGARPSRRGLTLQGPDAEGCVTIHVVPDAGDPTGNNIRLPFFYFPGVLAQAVEIVLLGLVGLRMDYYLLADDVSLTHLGGEWLQFPEESLAQLTAMADRTLARLEAEHPGQDPLSIFFDSRVGYGQTPYMVTGVDRAKSEALLSELTLPAEPELRQARQRLAEAEVRRVSAAVDGRTHARLKAAEDVAQAGDTYRELRQKLGTTRKAEFPELFDGIVEPGRAFVQFAESEGFLNAGVVVHDGERLVAQRVGLSGLTAPLYRATEAWRGQASREDQERWLLDLLDQFGELIMRPVLDAVAEYTVAHLILCPSRALEPFPLHAARVGGQRLDDLHDVSYTPSAAVLRASLRLLNVAANQTLVAGFSGAQVPTVVGLPPIHGPAKEAALLGAILPDAIVRVDDLDATALQAEMARYGVVHLAGHGRARASDWDSGLWIGGPSPSAAYLSSAAVLAGPPLDAVSLVVLNACETAVDRVGGIAVQAWRGLDAAFLARGTRAVVSSLWTIEDRAAAVWSVVFHAERVAGTTLAHACKVAADTVRTGAVPERTRQILDRTLPGWADELTATGDHRPLTWAAWRLSGICW